MMPNKPEYSVFTVAINGNAVRPDEVTRTGSHVNAELNSAYAQGYELVQAVNIGVNLTLFILRLRKDFSTSTDKPEVE